MVPPATAPAAEPPPITAGMAAAAPVAPAQPAQLVATAAPAAPHVATVAAPIATPSSVYLNTFFFDGMVPLECSTAIQEE